MSGQAITVVIPTEQVLLAHIQIFPFGNDPFSGYISVYLEKFDDDGRKVNLNPGQIQFNIQLKELSVAEAAQFAQAIDVACNVARRNMQPWWPAAINDPVSQFLQAHPNND